MYKMKRKALVAVALIIMMLSSIPVYAQETITEPTRETEATQPLDKKERAAKFAAEMERRAQEQAKRQLQAAQGLPEKEVKPNENRPALEKAQQKIQSVQGEPDRAIKYDPAKEKQALENGKKDLQGMQDRLEKLKGIKADRAEFNAIVKQNVELRKAIADNRQLVKLEIKRITENQVEVSDEVLSEAQALIEELKNGLTAMGNTTDAISKVQTGIKEGMQNKDVEKVSSTVGTAITIAKERNTALTELTKTMETLLELVKGIK